MDDNQLLDTASERLASAYAGAGQPAAIDPALIAMLLELGMSLLKDCMAKRSGGSPAPTPASIIARCKKPDTLALFQARRHVRVELRDRYGMGAWLTHDGDRLARALLAACADAQPEELAALVALPL